ncbi:MAG: TetR/AcrR family transcriptional regulator [Hungatella sp.]
MNKSATSKEILLQIAREIAYREGISKLSIRRLAADSQVAIGTVYNYYPSKSDLVAAVLEDFWRNVFHGDHFDTESDDFIKSFEEIYQRLKVNLALFHKEFLDDLISMEKADRLNSRQTEQLYMEHMKSGMVRILKRDGRISPRAFAEDFTEKQFVDFAFSNMECLLHEEATDCAYFKQVLERLLYP